MTFYLRTNGSDLNSGTSNDDVAPQSSSSGIWNGTNTFTAGSGIPFHNTHVGDWASIFLSSATVTAFVAQITAASDTVLTLDATARYGTAPSPGALRMCNVGGAWKTQAPAIAMLGADAFEDQIAAAVASELNDPARPWAPYFGTESVVATVTRAPWYLAQDLATLKVAVVPLTQDLNRQSRDRHEFNYGIAIDLQRMVEPTDTTRLKSLSRVTELIQDWFRDAHMLTAMAGWGCLKTDRLDIYSLDRLNTQRVWETLISLGVRGYR